MRIIDPVVLVDKIKNLYLKLLDFADVEQTLNITSIVRESGLDGRRVIEAMKLEGIVEDKGKQGRRYVYLIHGDGLCDQTVEKIAKETLRLETISKQTAKRHKSEAPSKHSVEPTTVRHKAMPIFDLQENVSQIALKAFREIIKAADIQEKPPAGFYTRMEKKMPYYVMSCEKQKHICSSCCF